MYNLFKNIIFRNLTLLILACCVFEQTGISVISQLFHGLQKDAVEFSVTDTDDAAKETENNKENSLRESWEPADAYLSGIPGAPSNLLFYLKPLDNGMVSFYPTVPTPPPDEFV